MTSSYSSFVYDSVIEEDVRLIPTGTEILINQWQEFELEAQATAHMLFFRGTNGSALMAELQTLWGTRGGDTESYLEHQAELNEIIRAALNIPTQFDLNSAGGYLS